jgi:polysaccharide export outer membrane protein
LVILVGTAVALGGCTKALLSTPNAEGDKGIFQVAGREDNSLTSYVIDPPDEITIKAPNIKEIDNSKQVVRPDGHISLNLLGQVKVSGLTPAQVQQELTKLASKYYTNPDVKVEVVANSKFFTIFGRGANNQKKIPYTGNDNVVKALAEAGLSEHAWPQQVWLVRPERNGQPAARAVVDFKNIQETGSFKQNYVIHEGDIITIPDSPLASFNFKATELFGPISGATEVGSGAQSVIPGR